MYYLHLLAQRTLSQIHGCSYGTLKENVLAASQWMISVSLSVECTHGIMKHRISAGICIRKRGAEVSAFEAMRKRPSAVQRKLHVGNEPNQTVSERKSDQKYLILFDASSFGPPPRLSLAKRSVPTSATLRHARNVLVVPLLSITSLAPLLRLASLACDRSVLSEAICTCRNSQS